jgi:cell division protease FtsH
MMKNNSLQKISDRIKEGKKKLAQVSEDLKSHFVGIDDVIDDILLKMEMWYVMPELLGRPTIINLWGMTGVGKTDLVRRLVRQIGFGDRFVEVMMKNSAHTNSTKIQDKIQMSSVEVGHPGVMLIDEIQKFRTVGRDGSEMPSGSNDDLWTLLSDGKFSVDANKRAAIYELVQELITSFAKRNLEEKKGVDGEGCSKKQQTRGLIERILSDSDYDYDEENIVVDLKTKEVIAATAIGTWQAKRVKSVLGVSTPIQDIMILGDEGVIELLLQALECPDTYEGDDYTKMLIFICGNLDEAFTSAVNVEDCDTDADIIRDSTKNIDITTIKSALSKRFRPEQIARFGNNHVIYKSLSSEAFRDIIKRNIEVARRHTLELTGVDVKFHSTMVDLIYRNGVFPLQGTRPLFTTIGSVVGHVTTHAVQTGADSEERELTVEYDNESSLISIFSEKTGDSLISFPYYGTIDEIRDKKDNMSNNRRLTSVHEAGHIIAYAALFGMVPMQAMSNSINSDGFVMTKTDNSGSPLSMMMDMAVGAAGFEAERFIFGDNLLVGGGATDDLRTVTRVAAYFVRRMCVVRECYILNNDDEQMYDSDVDGTNCAIRNAVKTAKEMACKIISENAECLMRVTDALYANGKLDPKSMKSIMEPYFGTLRFDIGDDASYPYDDMYLEKLSELSGEGVSEASEFEKKRKEYAEEIKEKILGHKDVQEQ